MQKTLPSGWELKKLGEVTYCLDSKRVPLNSKQREKIKGDIPYYGANGEVDRINQHIFDEELLLVAEDGGSWGFKEDCAYIIKGKSWVNNHAHVLRVKSEVLIKFIESYLNLTNLKAYISGTTRGKLNQKDLNNIQVPIPPLSIQKKIVEIIEHVEQLKQRREKANEETRKVLQAIFMKMFGDPTKNEKKFTFQILKEIVANERHSLKRGPFGGSLKKEIFVREGYKVYEQQHAIKNNFDIGDYYVTKDKYEEMLPFAVRAGDIIISCSGTIGKVAIVPNNVVPGIINQALLKISVDRSKVLQIYLKYFLEFPTVQRKLFGSAEGSGIKNVASMDVIKNTKIPVPPISLQSQFVEFVEKVYRMEKHQEKSASEINFLFDSLMQKAFNGELVQ